ncbi:hypothetical protein ABBQ32_000863 [Trebouxia sp. C0010 RCD-2024]
MAWWLRQLKQLSHTAVAAEFEPGSEPGSEGVLNPDSETHLVSMPPLLLVAVYRCMNASSNKLVLVPLLNHLTDDWRTWELTDVSVLVAKLWFGMMSCSSPLFH